MPRAHVTVEGIDELRKRLRQLPEDSIKAGRKATDQAGDDVVKDMRAGVPVNRSDLKYSIQKRRRGALSMDVGVFGGAWWGALQEFGTSQQPARPFAEPAARAEEARYPKRMAAALGEYL